ncbi:MAG: lysoplasmalogenase [Oscillospiraceae bacterium]|nr:lysoplasmalogenase [Oscillospiraceae bacterium]
MVIPMSSVAIAIISVIYVAVLVYYCALEKRDNFRLATTVKVILSAFASVICIYAAILLDSYVFYIFALAFVFTVPADYFLQYIKTNLTKYRIGITLFGLVHICLLISYYLIYPVSFFEFVIFAVFVAILLVFQIKGKWQIGKEKAQINVYTVIVVFMSAKAISIFIAAPAIYTVFLALGGLFFFISDLYLGIWAYSGKDTYPNLVINRATYFAALFCLAFSLVSRLYTNPC